MPNFSLTVVSAETFSTRGPNNQPAFGDVTFSDGKTYMFFRLPKEAERIFSFVGHRRRQYRESVTFTFLSDAREAALIAYFDNHEPKLQRTPSAPDLTQYQ